MKRTMLPYRSLARCILPLLACCLLLLSPLPAPAQEAAYSQEELAQLLAPIALYPDPLLSQILMAATYPLEVIEADRWLRHNPGLQGAALDGVLLQQDWDPSVEALCHFPDLLALMSERISETTSLGNAFLAQQGEVMDMIQRLRARAYAEGTLRSNARQQVIVDNGMIRIEPIDPRVVYVPYYDPLAVYGSWWYPAYPPYYWGPPGVYLGVGFGYWPAVYFGFTYGSWCSFDWSRRIIHIDTRHRPRYVRQDRWHEHHGRWEHAPRHRRGVAYRDRETARRYGQVPHREEIFRRDIRGFPAPSPDRERVRARDRSPKNTGRGAMERNRERERQTLERRAAPPLQVAPPRPKREERSREPRAVTPRQLQQRQSQDRQVQDRQLGSQRQLQQRQLQDRQVQQRQVQQRQPAVTPRQLQERQLQERQRVESERRQRARDNVFNRVDEGRREGLSSERGRQSRQESARESRQPWSDRR